MQLFKGNRLSIFNNFNKKERNARGASDLNPIETTTPQKAVDKSFGKYLWNTGPNPTYKFGNQWVVSDRLLLDVQYAHIGNNFTLGLQSPDLRTTQPTFVVATGMNGRSAAESVFIRPVNSVTFNSTYFRPGFLGGDHSFKFGGYWRDSNTTSINHTGGYGTVRFPNAPTDDCPALAAANSGDETRWCHVDLTRDGNSVYDLLNYSAYVQDTITKGRTTLQLGLRYDYNRDKAMPSSIVANPLGGPWLPAINFPGADPGVAFNDLSPRLGITYNVTGDGRTLARANYARYFGQVGNGGVASSINPVGTTTLRYAWTDANRNQVAEEGEIALDSTPLNTVGNWSAANPGNTVSANSVDPNLKNDTTDEFILGLDREIGRGFAVGANYIYRKYGNFQWNDRTNFTSADYAPLSFTPTTGLPGRRRSADRGLAVLDGHLLRADDPATDGLHPVERPWLPAGLQWHRADGAQAPVLGLADEHQLHLQHHRRPLRRFPGRRQPGERHRGNDSDLRGSDQPRVSGWRPVPTT